MKKKWRPNLHHFKNSNLGLLFFYQEYVWDVIVTVQNVRSATAGATTREKRLFVQPVRKSTAGKRTQPRASLCTIWIGAVSAGVLSNLKPESGGSIVR